MATLPSAHRPGFRRQRLAVIALAAVVAAVGLLGFARYVHDYILYRGFGPPVATVQPAIQGRIATLAFRSAALGGRSEHALVYLPAAYRTHPRWRFPVVYLLHGTPGDPRTAFVNSLHVAPRLDLLVARGLVHPLIVVMPPGSPSTYDRATEWADGPAPGSHWFRYLTHDLLHAVDGHLRTIRSRSARGIGGYSSGADAALNAILLRPHLFSVAEGWSGDYRQTPATVGRDAALVRRFSALSDRAAARSRAACDGRPRVSLQRATRPGTREHAGRGRRPAASGRPYARERDGRRPRLGALVEPARRRPALLLRSSRAGPRMTTRRALRRFAEILAIPLGLVVALGLIDALRWVPGPELALALPLRETGHADGAAILVVGCVPAAVFGLLVALAPGHRPSVAAAVLRSAGVYACALALQAISLQLVRQASIGFDWHAAAGSTAPAVCALGALAGTAGACRAASSDRWRRRGLQERPVGGSSDAAPLAKIGS